jgi:hypothetical protein
LGYSQRIDDLDVALSERASCQRMVIAVLGKVVVQAERATPS